MDGAWSSRTLTVNEQVAVLPCWSITCSVSVCKPREKFWPVPMPELISDTLYGQFSETAALP
jgi:hypothetical protein